MSRILKPVTGGAITDFVTAQAGEILKGYIGADKDGEPVNGTLELTGNAVATRVVAGSTYYKDNAKVRQTGTMPDRGSGRKAASIGVNSQGLYYYIDHGWYHEGETGNGWIYATAQDAINALGIKSVVNFKAAQYGNRQVQLTWARPSKGLWSGIRIVGKQGGYPANAEDGAIKVDTADTYWTSSVIATGTWYFRAWNYVTWSGGRQYGTYVDATINNSAVNGNATLSGAGVWTVPANVRRIRYIVVGHGGYGGIWEENSDGDNYGAGGGGGGYFATGYMNVTPGQQINYNVPSSGDTSFGTVVSKHGTVPQPYGSSNHMKYIRGGNGGSGGGGYRGTPGGEKGRGGSNGGNGDGGTYVAPGYGQGTSTTGFNGVLYSGGGGAGGYTSQGGAPGGAGGGGRGGGGGASGQDGTNGTDGLGGGAGGAGSWSGGGSGGAGTIYIAWGDIAA